jgi:hypothetical protein
VPYREDLGFQSLPENGLKIVRSRTLLGNLRLWEIPRSEKALDTVVEEIGRSPIPGLYVLLDERAEKKAYIGQTEDLRARLLTHIRTPEEKIRQWQRAFILNDGRSASQSDLNDENIRLTLENYLVDLFKINRYQVVTSSTRLPSLSSNQRILCDAFREEINILLSKRQAITRFLLGRPDDEVYLDEARKILLRKGHEVEKWGEKYAVIDGEPAIIRPGSQKPKGWQVTFRGSKSLAQLKDGQGFLLMNRGGLVLLPLQEVRDFVLSVDEEALQRDTVDVFLRFEEEKNPACLQRWR